MHHHIETHEPKLHHDESIESAKRDALKHMKWAPIYNAISGFCQMVSGPLMAAGLMGGIIAGSFTSAAIIMTAIGATLQMTSLAINFAASRVYQHTGFEQQEIACKSNAKCLVEELKANHLVLAPEEVVHSHAARRDGKTWEAAYADSKSVERVLGA